jgi:hypothetical protein
MKLRAKPDRVTVIAAGLGAGGPLGAAQSGLLDMDDVVVHKSWLSPSPQSPIWGVDDTALADT